MWHVDKVEELVFLYLDKTLQQPFYCIKGHFYDYFGFHLYSRNKENITFVSRDCIGESCLSLNMDIVSRVSGYFGIENNEAHGYVMKYLEVVLKPEQALSEKIKSMAIY